MSRIANDWVWKQNIKPATHKLILLAMADRADEYHCCYPSIARLERDTGLDRKTIQKGISNMIACGLLSDTGKRVGTTNKVRVLRMNIPSESSQNRDSLPADNNPKNGNVPKNGNNPKNGTLNDPNFGTLNDPKNGMQNHPIEPPNEPLPPSGVSARATAAPSPEFPDPPPEPPPHAKPKRKQPLPDDFAVTDAMRAWFAEQGFGFALQGEHERFCDYWRGRGEPMKDWEAVWRNWMRKAADFAKPKPQAQRPSGHDLSRMDYGETRIPKDVDWLQGV